MRANNWVFTVTKITPNGEKVNHRYFLNGMTQAQAAQAGTMLSAAHSGVVALSLDVNRISGDIEAAAESDVD